MDINILKTQLKTLVDNFVKAGSLKNPLDLVLLCLQLTTEGILAYKKVDSLAGSAKKAYVTEAVTFALQPLVDYDIKQIPDWIEIPMEGLITKEYIPLWIDQIFKTNDSK